MMTMYQSKYGSMVLVILLIRILLVYENDSRMELAFFKR